MARAPLAFIPSPYGVDVPVFGEPNGSSDKYEFNIDGMLTMAGVHGDSARKRCRAAIDAASTTGGFSFNLLLEHGGRKAQRLALPRPKSAITPTIPRGMDAHIPLENWASLVMDAPNWKQRSAALLPALATNLDQLKNWDGPQEVFAFGLSTLLTAALEHLAEHEVDCLEAAAFYSLSAHEEWSRVGVEWLQPVAATWFADWVAARPIYRHFAQACRAINTELPTWIEGARDE